jgi:hypothetical protein
MVLTFPEECVLSREERGVFLDTAFPSEHPCEGCPRSECEVKLRLDTASVLGGGIESDYHAIKCGRCGAAMVRWRISGRARTWECSAVVPDAYDNEFPCGFTYTTRSVLAEW